MQSSRLSRALHRTLQLPLLGEFSLKALLVLVGTLAVSLAIWFGLDQHSVHIRLTLVTFVAAIAGWVFTRINDTYIALAAAMSFALAGLERPEDFFSSLGDSMVWLLLAAFFVAVAVRQSGLAQRLARAVAARARSVEGLFYALTAVIVVTAYFIPSTSGRAALMLPVFMAFASVLPRRVVTALAILFPVAILLSAVASLIGAGAHLITADVVVQMGGERLDFLRWMVLGTPLALVSSFASTWVILRLFLSPQERSQRLELAHQLKADAAPLKVSPSELYVLWVVLGLVGLWMTEELHGLNNTLVALLGAMAVTLPRLGNISFKEGLKGVEWNILLFMAATLELGEALVESGAAGLLVEGLFSTLQSSALSSPWAVAGLVILVSLTAHLVIVSRSARSTVLVPLVVVLAAGLGYNGTALAFISTAAAGFCLTLMVSAKPLGLYGQMERPTFTQSDLLRLSSVLLPLHAVILSVFAFLIWPAMGLSLERAKPYASPPPVWQALPPMFNPSPPPVQKPYLKPQPQKTKEPTVAQRITPPGSLQQRTNPNPSGTRPDPNPRSQTLLPNRSTVRPADPRPIARLRSISDARPVQRAPQAGARPNSQDSPLTPRAQPRPFEQTLQERQRSLRKQQLIEENQRRERERRALRRDRSGD